MSSYPVHHPRCFPLSPGSSPTLVVTLLLLVGAAGCHPSVVRRTPGPDSPLRIAVTPLEDESGRHLGFGLLEIIDQRLWGVSNVSVTALNELSVEVGKSPTQLESWAEADIMKAAGTLQVDAWIYGTISSKDDQITLRLKAYAPGRGPRVLLERAYPPALVPKMVADVLRASTAALGVRFAPDEQETFAAHVPNDLETYRLLSNGVFNWYQANYLESSQLGANYWTPIDKAVQDLSAAVDRDPDLFEAWNELGYALLENFERKRAEEVFQKALDIWPHFADALMGMAISGYRRANRAATLDYARRCIGANPSIHLNRVHLARFHYSFGDTEEAISLLEKLNAEEPRGVTNYLLLSDWYYQRNLKLHKPADKLLDDSIAVLTRGLERRSDSPELLSRRAMLLDAKGSSREAQADAQAALNYDPLSIQALAVMLGVESEPTWDRLRHGLATQGREAAFELYRARVYMWSGMVEPAVSSYRAYLADFPDDWASQLQYANALMAAWRQTGDRAYLEEAPKVIVPLRGSSSMLARAQADKAYANLLAITRNLPELRALCQTFDRRGVFRQDCLFMEAYLLDVDNQPEAYQRLEAAEQIDPDLITLFEGDFFTWDQKALNYLLGMINEKRGFLNLAFLQWSEILMLRMVDDS